MKTHNVASLKDLRETERVRRGLLAELFRDSTPNERRRFAAAREAGRRLRERVRLL